MSGLLTAAQQSQLTAVWIAVGQFCAACQIACIDENLNMTAIKLGQKFWLTREADVERKAFSQICVFEL